MSINMTTPYFKLCLSIGISNKPESKKLESKEPIASRGLYSHTNKNKNWHFTIEPLTLRFIEENLEDIHLICSNY